MANARETRNTTAHAGSKRRRKLWFVVVASFMAWAVYTLFNQHNSYAETEMRLAEIKRQLAESEAISASLQQQIERLSDPEYIQELARKEQGMIVPGEQPIQVTEKGD